MQDFSEIMSSLSDAALITIVALQHTDYTPDAVSAAQHELQQRDISPEAYKALLEQVTEIYEAQRQRDTEPLHPGLKVLLLFIPLAFPLLYITRLLKIKQYARKAKETIVWFFMGTMLWIIAYIIYQIL